MDKREETTINAAYFDAYTRHVRFGYELPALENPEVQATYQAILDSIMVSATEVGVAVGADAKQYADTEALAKAEEQDVLEPLYEKAHYPIECDRELTIIPRKIGEARGMYFARVVAAVHESDDEEKASNLFQTLAIQLMLEPANYEYEGKHYTDRRFMSDGEIDAELSLLDKIVDAGELTDLEGHELEILKVMIEVARDAHDQLKLVASQTNIKAVETEIQRRKVERKAARIWRRVGAVVCLAAASITLPGLQNISDRVSSRVEAKGLESSSDLQALLALKSELGERQGYTENAQFLANQVASETADELDRKGHNEADVKALTEIQKIARATEKYFSDTSPEETEIFDLNNRLINVKTELTRPKGDFGNYLLLGGILIPYSVFAFFLMRSASKNGGRLEPLRRKVLPKVKEGAIPRPYYAIPASVAVQSYNLSNLKQDHSRMA